MAKRKRPDDPEPEHTDPWWAFRSTDISTVIELFHPTLLKASTPAHIHKVLDNLWSFVEHYRKTVPLGSASSFYNEVEQFLYQVAVIFITGKKRDTEKLLDWHYITNMAKMCPRTATLSASLDDHFTIPALPAAPFNPFTQDLDLDFLDEPPDKKRTAPAVSPPESVASSSKVAKGFKAPNAPLKKFKKSNLEVVEESEVEILPPAPSHSAQPHHCRFHIQVACPTSQMPAAASSSQRAPEPSDQGRSKRKVPTAAAHSTLSQIADEESVQSDTEPIDNEFGSPQMVLLSEYDRDPSKFWTSLNSNYTHSSSSGEPDVMPATMLVPASMVFNGILPPGFHKSLFVCTNCATRGKVCVYVGPGRACWACAKNHSARCNFATGDRFRMQTAERMESFNGISNPVLVQDFQRLIELRRRVDFAYNVLLHEYEDYTSVTKDLAIHYFQTKSVLRPEDFADRFENPESIQLIEDLFIHLDITYEHARQRWLKQHPASAVLSVADSVSHNIDFAESKHTSPALETLRFEKEVQMDPDRTQRSRPFSDRIQEQIPVGEIEAMVSHSRATTPASPSHPASPPSQPSTSRLPAHERSQTQHPVSHSPPREVSPSARPSTAHSSRSPSPQDTPLTYREAPSQVRKAAPLCPQAHRTPQDASSRLASSNPDSARERFQPQHSTADTSAPPARLSSSTTVHPRMDLSQQPLRASAQQPTRHSALQQPARASTSQKQPRFSTSFQQPQAEVAAANSRFGLETAALTAPTARSSQMRNPFGSFSFAPMNENQAHNRLAYCSSPPMSAANPSLYLGSQFNRELEPFHNSPYNRLSLEPDFLSNLTPQVQQTVDDPHEVDAVGEDYREEQ
ncbi:hypothetical protein FB451DRAFT_1571073 [Mycena latifolia]|nr:hypothetical protein FB451DRAFT_1571073 [Mycena latifolia]